MSVDLRDPTPAPLNSNFQLPNSLVVAENESVASILLKLEQAPSRDIVITAPPLLGALRNPVSMRLLQRKAEDLGLTVSIVTRDEMTRQLCAEIGFGCYPDVAAYRRDSVHVHRPEPSGAAAGQGSWVSLVAALCLLLVVGILAYIVLPAASITVTRASAALSADVPIIADGSLTSIDLAAGKIPARVVVQEVAGSATVNATGQRDVPNQPARGIVTFTNLSDEPLTVPKSTILLAGKVVFFTTQDTLLSPSVKIADTPITGAAASPIQAAEPGEAGNVPVGAITALQGPLSPKVSVINKAATSGGSNKKTSYLSADDQAKTKKALLDQLRQQALDKISNQIPRNETFLPSPASVGDSAVEELTFEESPEQVTTQTRLNMKVLVRGLTFQGDDVNQVVAQAMDSAAQREGSGARLSDAPLGIDPPAVIANDGATIKMQVHTTGRIVRQLKSSALAERVRGMDPATARSTLLGTPGVGQADVQLWPAWATKVPSFSWRTQTTFVDPSN